MKFVKTVVAAILLLYKDAEAFTPRKSLVVKQYSPTTALYSYQNDGPFSFMKDFLEIGGLTKEGKSIYFGVLTKDANTAATPPEEALKLRKLATENLTNIDDAERARRDQAGDVFIALSAIYIIWTSLFADDGGFSGHFLRFASIIPIFLAYGYKKSARDGL